ncbi:hypothetical protein G6K97_30465 [Agrobacterium rhizogenes]|uniref:hypothetical protein n=1 Tax=Rhizobium rhizogenes TaxID=359 RepID=UPI00080FCD4D|nr:hypothetical protein [Rhizobium rhizogenes]NTH79184.1 hypothetical protein [Rhizobium rhizogenes]NTH87475.1 hypothetical protein [Rhizobium rhizogenes]NTI46661.1 hypothetical protein [Rhizobium rhizogenes]OCJ14993.1 hypothetical protein A6U88_33950 [Agrobacterium sp. B131/95]
MPKALLIASVFTSAFLVASDTAFAQCTLPNQLQNGDMADAMKVAGNFSALTSCADDQTPSGSANSILYNTGSGSLAGATPLADGQVLIGSTGNPPQAGTLAAGSGIAITGGSASITISATGSGTGAAVDWLNKAAVVKPNSTAFTMQTSTTPPTGAAVSATGRGMLLSTNASANNQAIMAEQPIPSGNWQATMLGIYTGPISSYVAPSLTLRDAVAKRAISFSVGGNGSGSSRFDYNRSSGGIGLDAYVSDVAIVDIGVSSPSEPFWSRVAYDGTNLKWSYSRDGENFTTVYTISATDYLTNLSTIGPAVLFYQPSHSSWNSGYHILSWNLASM